MVLPKVIAGGRLDREKSGRSLSGVILIAKNHILNQMQYNCFSRQDQRQLKKIRA
jgi:hypothetical protein